MTDHDILYRAILDDPEDDTLRLVYADALEESGDPRRAAFVRTQVELSRLPDYDPAWVIARANGDDRDFDPLWAAELELPEGIAWTERPFRRGLPAAIRADDGAAFVAHANELFARYPIEALELSAVRVHDGRAFAECAWLQRLTSLALVQGASGPAVAQMLESPHLARLTELRIGSELTTTATVSAVVRSWVFKRLTSLGVRNDQGQGRRLADEFAALVKPPPLTKLDLSGNRLTAEPLARLLMSRAAHGVQDLNLSDNNLGAEGMAALCAGDRPELRALYLLRTRPQEAGVTTLVQSRFFSSLRSLSLGGNILGPSAALAIANGLAVSLRVLDLRENRIGDRGAIALAGGQHLANLIELDLAESQMSDAGAEALAASPHLGGLLYLDLSGNPIADRAADRLRERFGDRVLL